MLTVAGPATGILFQTKNIVANPFVTQLFPAGVPRLWCPTLTHFYAAHQPDAARIKSHLATLAPHVGGILVPGSTGEGWEMNDADIRSLLTIVLDAVQGTRIRVLIGVLKTDVQQMLSSIDALAEFRTHPAVVGFAVCPPKGSELTQREIHGDLAELLTLGWPMALYQLPQVTLNEMAPETVASLAAEFPNFILFKDTSGKDRVANSGLDFGDVFMVRGSEQGGYAAWPRAAGGPYDGLLLSTANVFANQYVEMLRRLDVGQTAAATEISVKLSEVVSGTFAIVAEFPNGNAFTNASKLLDHCLAYGDHATHIAPPMLYSGTRLPHQFVEQASEILRHHSLLPATGYFS